MSAPFIYANKLVVFLPMITHKNCFMNIVNADLHFFFYNKKKTGLNSNNSIYNHPVLIKNKDTETSFHISIEKNARKRTVFVRFFLVSLKAALAS